MTEITHPANEHEAHDDGVADSHSLITMRPAVSTPAFIEKQRKAFAAAFHQTLQGKTEGGMSTYLFYDLNAASSSVFGGLTYDASTILSGGRAWERRINENATLAPVGTHSFISDDRQSIAYSIQQGLLNHLPARIQFVSYGGGDEQAFTSNEGQIIRATQGDPSKTITDLWAVDILPRYVDDMTWLASRRYNLTSHGVQGDFLRNGRLAITKAEDSIPVVMIFGGPFENVSVDTHKPDVVEQAQTNIAIAWGKMNIQHGLGSIVIKTFDRDQDKARQEAKYAPTRNFEAFELSYLARAIEAGMIKNPDYDIFEHWRLASEYDPAVHATKLYAECKTAHTLQTDQGDVDFAEGDRRTVITLSHKFSVAAHVRAAERAGYEVLAIYEQPGNMNPLMIARAVRDPDADILQSIPYPR